MVQRQTIPSHHTYKTRSNRMVKVRTPGKNLVLHIVKKRGKLPKCGACHRKLLGIKMARSADFSRMKKHHRTVNRVYGGVLCSECVKNKIIGAFMDEELKRAEVGSKAH